jgi:hypothetical protein
VNFKNKRENNKTNNEDIKQIMLPIGKMQNCKIQEETNLIDSMLDYSSDFVENK